MQRARGFCFVVSIVAASCASALAQDESRWIEYVPGGIEARAITDRPQCPVATLDGAVVPMRTRAAPNLDFPIRVCALPIAADAKAVTIGGVPMQLPVARPNRIVLIGDTGCRLKDSFLQACNDPRAWPFQVVADVAATFQPDLVIHVGDYYYRETPCPPGNADCAGSPYGDNWASWQADFFAPARLLLQAAPWILVRGNHEDCNRGGAGWFRTLDPYPYDPNAGRDGCVTHTDPFVAAIGGVNVVVMDTASARENRVNEQEAALYREQFKSIAGLAPSGLVWLAFHRVIWSTDGTEVPEKSGGDNKTLAAAAKGNIPANVQLMLNGHQHKFEVDAYVQDLPATIVAGLSGDLLSPSAPSNPVGLVVNGVEIKAGLAIPRKFGFAMLERTPESAPDQWTVTAYDIYGQPLGHCRIEGRSANCTK